MWRPDSIVVIAVLEDVFIPSHRRRGPRVTASGTPAPALAPVGVAARAVPIERPALGAGATGGMFGESGTIGWIGSIWSEQGPPSAAGWLLRPSVPSRVAAGALPRAGIEVGSAGFGPVDRCASSATTRWRQTLTAHAHARQ